MKSELKQDSLFFAAHNIDQPNEETKLKQEAKQK
jgi:hypothetical protein